MNQHRSLQPIINIEACSKCRVCIEVCPRSAITRDEIGPSINYELCIECGECVATCSTFSMAFDRENGLQLFIEMLTEHAYGAVLGKQARVGYLAFLLQITPDCDCVRGVVHQ
jgi:hypothetical protein